jgi:hypothetical protein
LGFRISGSGFKVQGLGFNVEDLDDGVVVVKILLEGRIKRRHHRFVIVKSSKQKLPRKKLLSSPTCICTHTHTHAHAHAHKYNFQAHGYTAGVARVYSRRCDLGFRV